MMLSTRLICQRDCFRDDSVEVPESCRWDVPSAENPWKDDRPFRDEEIASILAEGIAANEPTVLDFEPVEYSADLVPASALDLPEVQPLKLPERYRGKQTVYTWLGERADNDDRPEGSDSSRQLQLQVTGGLIERYRDRGNVSFELFAAREATLQPVDRDESVPPDGKPRVVVLTSPYAGQHWLEWHDGHDMTRVEWPEGVPRTFRSTLEDPLKLGGRWSLYFYVPRGTKTVGGFATMTNGRLFDGSGREVFNFDDLEQPDYFSVAVPDGQDGTLWRLAHCTGSRMLMTVPPYLAPSADALLLPREVVEADANRP